MTTITEGTFTKQDGEWLVRINGATMALDHHGSFEVADKDGAPISKGDQLVVTKSSGQTKTVWLDGPCEQTDDGMLFTFTSTAPTPRPTQEQIQKHGLLGAGAATRPLAEDADVRAHQARREAALIRKGKCGGGCGTPLKGALLGAPGFCHDCA